MTNVSAAAHALATALPELFPKEQIIMKLIPIHASIAVLVQILALLEQFHSNIKVT
jgi:hypothetical protein